MNPVDTVKLFGLNNLTIEADLRAISTRFDLALREDSSHSTVADAYYRQFPESIRVQAERMALHYTLFYCLENSVREMIQSRLEERHGENWWTAAVPQNVSENAQKNRTRETQTGVTPRSSDLIDYTNFGELGEIIKANWEIFGDTFRDIKAVERILGNLNTLRAPIAHCSELADDEVVRLHLSLRDWFRQMA